MVYRLSFYVGIMVLAASCAGTNKVSTKDKQSKIATGTDACASALVSNSPHISWYKRTDEVFKDMQNPVMLPTQHEVYAVDTTQLRTFFMAAKAGEVETAIPLSGGLGCKVFTLKRSGAMSEDLQKRYPDMVSLQGGERDTRNGDVRLDYNGRAVQAQIVFDNATYIMRPISTTKGYFYVMYRKEETQPQEPLKESVSPNQRQKIIQKTYDK